MAETHHPTLNFRWQIRFGALGKSFNLQQAWHDITTGEIIWKDIQVVDEFGDPVITNEEKVQKRIQKRKRPYKKGRR